MIVAEATAQDAPAWDDFVRNHPHGSIYHTMRWLELVQRVFGHRQANWIARGEKGGSSEILGVLPLTRLRSPMFGHFCVSLPFVNFGGALGTSAEAEHALMDAGVAWATHEGARHIEFRDSRARTSDWPVRTDKVLMELTLPESEEGFLKSIGAKLRSQAKRALREDAQVLHGGIELVDDFYSVFSQNMRDLGTPVYGKSLFKEILQTFPEQAGITLVTLAGEPAAAGFTMTYGGRREIPWASALRRYNRVSVNMLLYAEIIKQAIRDKQRVFDFGRSTIDAGTFRFKKQWGAVPRQLYWHYWLRDGGNLPGLNPDNPKFALAIKIWQKLPLPITEFIGPPIVKYLP